MRCVALCMSDHAAFSRGGFMGRLPMGSVPFITSGSHEGSPCQTLGIMGQTKPSCGWPRILIDRWASPGNTMF